LRSTEAARNPELRLLLQVRENPCRHAQARCRPMPWLTIGSLSVHMRMSRISTPVPKEKFGRHQEKAHHAGLERTFGLPADFPGFGATADEPAAGFRPLRFQPHYIFY
jgi:hypothetical protein